MKQKGRFGQFGGFYVPEVLIPVLEELEEGFYRYYKDEHFVTELNRSGLRFILNVKTFCTAVRIKLIILLARDFLRNIWARPS